MQQMLKSNKDLAGFQSFSRFERSKLSFNNDNNNNNNRNLTDFELSSLLLF